MKLFCLLLFCSLSSVAFSQSCPVPRLMNIPRTRAIELYFCYNPNVYMARVVGATCNCIPASGDVDLQCQDYTFATDDSSVVNVEVVSRSRLVGETCTNLPSRLGVPTCSEVATSLVGSGIEVQNVTTDLPPASVTAGYCFYSCPFNMNYSQYSQSGAGEVQPCVYTLEVLTVFKGNYTRGETQVVPGPDVVTLYGQPGRVLQLQEEYIVGIGGWCSPISQWSTVNSYSNTELNLLTELRCGAVDFLPSVALFLALSALVALFG